MDLLDLVIVLTAVIAAVGGFRLGFIGRVTSWLGLALGFYLAIRLLPTIVVDFATASPGVLVTLAAIVLIGGAMAGQGLGILIGSKINRALPLGGPWRHVDRAVGAAVGVVGILALLWLLIPSVAAVPGWPARAATGSEIARWISRDFPAPPDPVQVLRRLIGSDAPEVFAELQPGQAAGPPPSTSPLSATVTARVVASTVKVEGEACNRIYEGSGFAVAPDLIVTNAHVVAGEGRGDTQVLLPSGRPLPATVVLFDPNIDLALLDVRSLGETPLSVESANVGDPWSRIRSPWRPGSRSRDARPGGTGGGSHRPGSLRCAHQQTGCTRPRRGPGPRRLRGTPGGPDRERRRGGFRHLSRSVRHLLRPEQQRARHRPG